MCITPHCHLQEGKPKSIWICSSSEQGWRAPYCAGMQHTLWGSLIIPYCGPTLQNVEIAELWMKESSLAAFENSCDTPMVLRAGHQLKQSFGRFLVSSASFSTSLLFPSKGGGWIGKGVSEFELLCLRHAQLWDQSSISWEDASPLAASRIPKAIPYGDVCSRPEKAD